MKELALLCLLGLSACRQETSPAPAPVETLAHSVASEAHGLRGELVKHFERDEESRSNQTRIEFLTIQQLIDGSGAFTNPAMAEAMGLHFGTSRTNWLLMVPQMWRTNSDGVRELEACYNHWFTNEISEWP